MYNELLERKQKGEKINIECLSKEELYTLYIYEERLKREIANLCDCTMGQLNYRLKKYNISFMDRCACRLGKVCDLLRRFDEV